MRVLQTTRWAATFALILCIQHSLHGQDRDSLNSIIKLDEAVSAGTFGIVVHDFSRASVVASKYEELNDKLKTRKSLKEFVGMLKEGQHVLGVAVYLNQRFPKEKIVPVSNGFPVSDLTTIPLDLFVQGKKKTVNVSSVTFGKLLFDYWRVELKLFDESDKE